MDQRALQVSKGVEEVLQASYTLLEAREQEEAQASRTQPPRERPQEGDMQHFLLCHRQANGACERFLMDLQHAEVLVRQLKTQGAGHLTASADEDPTALSAGTLLPTQFVAGMKTYDEAVQHCFWTEKK
uniref:Uncharacterized protein n=1 Tax=Hemiselmis andersenii TaxID=464988 RepID=A0A6U4ME42_HEMAN